MRDTFRFPTTAAALGAVAVVVPLALTGCVAKDSAATTLAVTSTDTECNLDPTTAATGSVGFKVTNNGSKVTEFYVFEGSRVLGEVEPVWSAPVSARPSR